MALLELEACILKAEQPELTIQEARDIIRVRRKMNINYLSEEDIYETRT